MDDAATMPVPTALKETADALTSGVQSRTLLHDAGEWLAGIRLPDRPMQQRVEDATSLIHQAEQMVQDITAILRRRVEVLRDGQPRVTRGPVDEGC